MKTERLSIIGELFSFLATFCTWLCYYAVIMQNILQVLK